jgi:hypothetical protein
MGSFFQKSKRGSDRWYSLAIRMKGVEFIDENGGDPGVRLRKRQMPARGVTRAESRAAWHAAVRSRSP